MLLGFWGRMKNELGEQRINEIKYGVKLELWIDVQNRQWEC